MEPSQFNTNFQSHLDVSAIGVAFPENPIFVPVVPPHCRC